MTEYNVALTETNGKTNISIVIEHGDIRKEAFIKEFTGSKMMKKYERLVDRLHIIAAKLNYLYDRTPLVVPTGKIETNINEYIWIGIKRFKVQVYKPKNNENVLMFKFNYGV